MTILNSEIRLTSKDRLVTSVASKGNQIKWVIGLKQMIWTIKSYLKWRMKYLKTAMEG